MALLEVCAGSIESIRAAYEGGAARVELCAALSEDGLTPSVGMMRYAKSLEGLMVHVLIRPRGGDFVYTEEEVRCMEADIMVARETSVDGVVIGALTKEGEIDMDVCRRLVSAAGDMNITFHRAFDVCCDPVKALEQIISLGCNRLLTSGHEKNAVEGIPMLKKLVSRAAGRLVVMPGCGVNPGNAQKILEACGAEEIHASARSSRVFGRLETDPYVVKEIVESINTMSWFA